MASGAPALHLHVSAVQPQAKPTAVPTSKLKPTGAPTAVPTTECKPTAVPTVEAKKPTIAPTTTQEL